MMVINMRCLILLLIMLLLTGCGMQTQQQVTAQASYSVVDDYGNVLKFTTKPKRVYATTLSIEEVLVDLLEPERLAAISEDALDKSTSLIAEKAAHISRKAPANMPVEAILAMQPDLVIVQENTNKAYVESIKDTGLKVFVTKVPTNLELVEKRILHIAEAVGEQERGQKMVSLMNKKVALVDNTMKNIPEKQRKIAMAYSLQGVFGSSKGLFHDICTRSGLRNGAALAGLTRGEHLSKEKIVSTNPDLFIFPRTSATKKGDVDKLRENVLHDPSLATVKAVQNQDYIVIDDRYRYSASQYMADAILILSRQAYPELYKEK